MKRLAPGIVLQLRVVEHVIARLGQDRRYNRRHLHTIKELCADLDRRGLSQWARQYRIAVERKMGAL